MSRARDVRFRPLIQVPATRALSLDQDNGGLRSTVGLGNPDKVRVHLLYTHNSDEYRSSAWFPITGVTSLQGLREEGGQ